jgi:adenylosuccinate lyase
MDQTKSRKEDGKRTDLIFPLNQLTAISPLDGRYREKVNALVPFCSEFALIKMRVGIEAKYLIALSDAGLIRHLQEQERKLLMDLGPELSLEQAERIKSIEVETRHDVKAMERAFREFVAPTSLKDTTEMIHFGLTSEDVNNLSYRLMLRGAMKMVCIPAMDRVVDNLVEKAKLYKAMPMLARTHGQPAIPTTVGKELANMAVRLSEQIKKIEDVELTGKFNGAVGNFNALRFAAPEINWVIFSRDFVKSFGLKPNLITTQINPYEDMIELFQAVQRTNNVLLDINQDMWRYISDEWFVQAVRKGEIGSSTMPQKVNPIHFENSEGNIQLANSLSEGMGRKLAVSRLQRDLSDSTTIRNVGVVLGYSLFAYLNTSEGLDRVRPNAGVIKEALNSNWNILAEGVQTLLRREGVTDPYSIVADLSKGRKIGQEEWAEFIEGLEVSDKVKKKLSTMLTPAYYIGYAEPLTDQALEDIANLRQNRGK